MLGGAGTVLAAALAWYALHVAAPRDVSAPATSAAPVAVAAPAAARPSRLSLLAGDGHAGLQDGPAAQARFADPYGLALAPDGRLYVADAGDNNRIRVITPEGTVSTLAGGDEGFRDGPGPVARFHTPSGLALDAAGNLYVADTGNHAIRKISPEGRVSTLAGTGRPGHQDGPGALAQFNGPIGVAVDASGRVLVADTYNDRIRAISPEGQVSTLAGGALPGDADGPGAAARFDTPCAVAVDVQGRVWVADTRNDALRRIDTGGQVTTLARGDPADDDALLRRPVSLAVGAEGALLVATLRRGALLRISAQGQVQALHADPVQRLSRPTSLALDGKGQLLVADAAAARIHRLRPGDDAATTAVIAGPLGPADERVLPTTGGRWPLRPQGAWHEVVGTLGEVRGDGNGEPRDHLHDGLDIRGDVGQDVLAIADAKLSSPLGSWGYGKLGEGLALDRLNYIHLRVGRTASGKPIDGQRFQWLRDASGQPERMRVRRGTRFAAGEPLGSINGMAHVHLSLGAPGYQRNPLALGFQGFTDRQAPRIAAVEFLDAAGQVLTDDMTSKMSGQPGRRVRLPRQGWQLVVDAWDQVDGNQPRRRLGLHSLGLQLLQADGAPVPGFERPQTLLAFDRLPAGPQAVKQLYDSHSGVTVHGSAETHFRYRLAGGVAEGQAPPSAGQAAAWPAGDYTLRIVAQDFAGNVALQRRDVAVRLPP